MKKIIVFSLIVGMMMCLATLPASAVGRSAAYGTSYGYNRWVELKNAPLSSIFSFEIKVPKDKMKVYVECDGYCYMDNVITGFAIGIDSPTEDVGTLRFYSAGDHPQLSEMMSGIHIAKMYELNKGTHTIYFLGGIYEGTGGACANYMTISALMFETGAVTGGFPIREGIESKDGISPDGRR